MNPIPVNLSLHEMRHVTKVRTFIRSSQHLMVGMIGNELTLIN